MKSVVAVALCGVVTFWAATAPAQQPANSAAAPSPPAQIFTPGALESLVGPIAFYPDSVVELVLDAAQNPPAIEAAAHSPAGSFQRSVLQLQQQEPTLLAQLDQQLAATTQLGVAARVQLTDVWAAVDRVRAKHSAALTLPTTTAASTAATTPASTAAPTTSAASPATNAPVTGAFIAGALSNQARQQPLGVYYRPGTAGGVYAPAINSATINTRTVNTRTANNAAVSAAAIQATNATQTAADAHHATNSSQQNANGSAGFSRSAATRQGVTSVNTGRPTGASAPAAHSPGNNRGGAQGSDHSAARGSDRGDSRSRGNSPGGRNSRGH